ncbi:MAG TPA: efflux RND transporter permease subunit [Candidatus Limiplasma sp.]|nr:efflux RND transporter permease subunit [Candidatus Limiplasma sp.]
MKLEKMLECLVKNRKITLFFVLLAVVAGVLAFVGMPKQETPDITSPYAMITTVYPGASANDVDSYVTEPIINSVKALKGYKTVTSFSYNNLSMILLEFEFSTDREEAFRTLRSALSELQGDLPESCGQIDVNTDITDTAGVLISLSSAELSNAEVVVQAKRIRDSLQEIDGFQRFEIIGNLNREITVTMNQTRMQSAGLTLSQAVSLIGAANTDLPLGTFAQNGQRTTVDYVGGFQNVDDVAAMGIGYSAQLGRVIQLKDIASVTEAPAARNTYYTHNGDQAVILAGYFKSDINVLPLKNEIQKTLDTLEGEQPEVLDVSLIMSQPQEINDSLIDFMRNLLVSVGLVILVVLVGMGIKNAVVVSVSLPLSVLLSFIAMNVLGIKIQQISIAALVLSLGMLVDNSIVVSDSI